MIHGSPFFYFALGLISALLMLTMNETFMYSTQHRRVVVLQTGTSDLQSDLHEQNPVQVEQNDTQLSNNAQHPTLKAVETRTHEDPSAQAKELYKTTRVLCWVMTHPEALDQRAKVIKTTWGPRCNKILYISDEDNKEFPAIGLNTSYGRHLLTAKVLKAFDYIYHHHFDDADWFLKADDDTYVIVENLRYMLSAYPASEPVFFGHSFVQPISRTHYFNGGGGYVLSKEALRRFGTRDNINECEASTKPEDVEIAKCLKKLGVIPKESFDSFGRTRFHYSEPEDFVNSLPLPLKGLKAFDKFKGRYHQGAETMSSYAISFHRLSSDDMKLVDFLLYRLKPYGIRNEPPLQNINPPLDKQWS